MTRTDTGLTNSPPPASQRIGTQRPRPTPDHEAFVMLFSARFHHVSEESQAEGSHARTQS